MNLSQQEKRIIRLVSEELAVAAKQYEENRRRLLRHYGNVIGFLHAEQTHDVVDSEIPQFWDRRDDTEAIYRMLVRFGNQQRRDWKAMND